MTVSPESQPEGNYRRAAPLLYALPAAHAQPAQPPPGGARTSHPAATPTPSPAKPASRRLSLQIQVKRAPAARQNGTPLITNNVYDRVILLRTANGGFGTAFTIDVSERQYLVTARHVLPEPDGVNMVSLEGPVQIDDLQFETLPGIRPSADIAVMPLDSPVTRQRSVTPTADGIVFGQDCFFLGYPYGLGISTAQQPELAFVKKGILSAQTVTPDGVTTMYLDGHNNPGFSGGPVVYYKPGTGVSEPRIGAVVSGYWIHRDEVAIGEAIVDGAVVRANSGIVITTSIRHALEVIEQAEG